MVSDFMQLIAAVTSSLIFGLVHMNFLQLFFAFSMGIILCYLFEATGKIVYCMLLLMIICIIACCLMSFCM
ncbi:MAG: CPBP family intramembrane metalloprotease [Clostridia bacterium]|nr:CPBP family intramembrane metalloprotease [Clostridia bacterium]